jgi:Na+-transporting NADH:ubiquinone oxidoreductase subunit NqrB
MTIDARLYQISCLTTFLLLGWLARDWTLQWPLLGTVLLVCLGAQGLGLWWRKLPQTIDQFYSPVITALGLALLLRADQPWMMVLAGLAAIGSKFLLRWQGKHLFNPANVGIVAALLFTHGAWISPGQWGAGWWLVGLFLGAGTLVLKQVGHWETTAMFLGSYAALEAARNAYLGWTWDVWGHRLMSGSLLLFALFMISDPKTTPNHPIARLLWALLVAVITFVLRNVWFINTAMIWALFAASLLVPLFDAVFAAERFVWKRYAVESL